MLLTKAYVPIYFILAVDVRIVCIAGIGGWNTLVRCPTNYLYVGHRYAICEC